MPSRKTLELTSGAWGLPRARVAAARVLAEPAFVRPLVRALASDDPVLRRRASDTARRVTEKQTKLLAPYAEEILGIFSESADDNWRTRAHLGLVVARTATSSAQRRRAAGLLMPLYYDPSNVVRCTAIEGLSVLAQGEPAIRAQFEALAEEALATGTLAMQNRARRALAGEFRLRRS